MMAGAGPEFSVRAAGPLEVAVIGAPRAEGFAAIARRPIPSGKTGTGPLLVAAARIFTKFPRPMRGFLV